MSVVRLGYTSALARKNGYTGVKCCDCGLVYVTPRPVMEEIDEAVKMGMHRIADDKAVALDVSYRPNWRNAGMYRRDIGAAFAVEIAAGRPLRWLDVGAGYGEFVKVLIDLLPEGSDVRGIEPMDSKTGYAQSVGLPVTNAALSDQTGTFDVVSIMNVLSHVPDFRSFLADLVKLLRPGGTIFLRTGNGGDLDDRRQYPDKLDFPDHLVFAGEGHVRRFLHEAGLEIAWQDGDRLDTLAGAAKSVVKKLLGRPSPIVLPYRSPFRDLRYRANLR